MAELYKFFNSAPGDARTYQAADFADYFGSVLSTGLLHTDNVPGMAVSVVAGTLTTRVTAGKAIMKGHLYENTAPLTLTHSLPEATQDRIDRVVLRLDLRNAERNIKLHVKQGVASASPVAPTLQRDNIIYEISLARVLVRKNTVQLLSSDLVDERLNEALCGLVYSLIAIPTSQFQAQWDAFMAGIQGSGFASATEFATHKADDVRHVTPAKDARWNNTVNAINIGGQNSDPNTTQEAYILTDHANSPGIGRFWHIQTFFYASRTGNRAQQAISYNGADPQIRVRHYNNNVWTAWSPDPFQSVVDGKNSVENAIEARGGAVSDVNNPPTFADLVNGVNTINTGKKWASGTATSSADSNYPKITVSGLGFKPKIIIIRSGQAFSMYDEANPSVVFRFNGTPGTHNANFDISFIGGYVNSNSFSLLTPFTNQQHSWITYE